MCGLCSKKLEEREAEKKALYREAEDLERLASRLKAMACGQIKPHTDEAKRFTPLAHSIIRYLVDEWL